MWGKKYFLCIVCCFALGYGQANVATESLYFMPYENTQALHDLLAHIKNATTSINIAIYSFTNREIAKALRDAAQKGVAITIIYDKSANTKNDASSIGYLAKYKNIEVCTLEGKKGANYTGIMHQKMAIIDDTTLILGSANWSKNAFSYNYETLLITQNPTNTHKAQQYFARMRQERKAF